MKQVFSINVSHNITSLFRIFNLSSNQTYLIAIITVPAEQLWKGITSVSNAGKKRGRGKGVGKKMAKDLNKGQIIGVGRTNMLWPGLNAPIIRGKELVQQQKLPEDPERFVTLMNLCKLLIFMTFFRLQRNETP